MSGQWPPEWGEPDWEDQEPGEVSADSGDMDEAHPELAAVTAALAAIPIPPMPGSVEARITAALAAEATVLPTGTTTTTSAGPSAHVLDTGRPRSLPSRRRRLEGLRRLRPSSVVAPVVAAILIGGFGYVLSLGGASSNSSGTTASGAGNSPAMVAPAARGAEHSMARAPAADLRPLPAGEPPPFVVTVNGTTYRQDMLLPQLRQAFTALRGKGTTTGLPPSPSPSSVSFSTADTSATSAPSAAASSAQASAQTEQTAPGVFAPSQALVGCVLKVTGNTVPSQVEYASYQGRPVYVILTPTRAWIVGVGCTARNTRIIATVSLTG